MPLLIKPENPYRFLGSQVIVDWEIKSFRVDTFSFTYNQFYTAKLSLGKRSTKYFTDIHVVIPGGGGGGVGHSHIYAI